ncbi:MAG: hypothetical protein V3T70_10530, partial [Phycisphaerae bacterium]
ATATRLSLVVAGVRNGQTVDVRVKSSNAGDTSVSGTCEILNLDVFSGAQATSLVSEVHLAKAAAVNKQIQTIATGVVEIKDDDGTTTLKTMTPSVDDQNAPTQNILTPS